MHAAVRQWDVEQTRMRTDTKLLLVKNNFERCLMIATCFLAVSTCTEFNRFKAFAFGGGPLLFLVQLPSGGLMKRIAHQVMQIAVHCAVIVAAFFWTDSMFDFHDVVAGLWCACFVLEREHKQTDLEGTVMLFSHFVMMCFSLLRFEIETVALASAMDISFGFWKLVELAESGKPRLDRSMLGFAYLPVMVIWVVWPASLSMVAHLVLAMKQLFEFTVWKVAT